MKIAVFGATGATGREIVRQALERGHGVQALARTPSKLEVQHPNLLILEGNVLDDKAVAKTIEGTSAVIISLGGKPGDKTRPLEHGTKNIITAMKAGGLKRIIAITSLGVGDSKGQAGFFFESIIVPLLLKDEFADKLCQETLLQTSGLEFVIARPGGLQTKPAIGTYQAARKLVAGSSARITRADVAHFCLEQLHSDVWLGQAVSLSN